MNSSQVKGPQGVELHVLSHVELRFEAPEIALWEQSHKFSQNSACMKIPKFPGCGNPVCEQPDHPEDQCPGITVIQAALVCPLAVNYCFGSFFNSHRRFHSLRIGRSGSMAVSQQVISGREDYSCPTHTTKVTSSS